MSTTKSAPAVFRFQPEVKAALALLADRDGRSMANMVEWLIRQQCERDGLGWPPEGVVTEPVKSVKKKPVARKRASEKS